MSAWLLGQIEASRPPESLVPGAVGRRIQELAGALATMEGRGTMAFGRSIDRAQHAELSPLIGRARECLAEWHARLEQAHGREGVATLHTIAARQGVTLPSMPEVAWKKLEAGEGDGAMCRALEGLGARVADREGLTALWRERGRLLDDDDVVHVQVGRVDERALRAFAQRLESAVGLALPVAYLRLLRTYDGVVAWSGAPDEEAESPTAPRDLGEPALWPIEVYGDHHGLEEVGLDGVERPFVFGGIADSGEFFFDIGAGDDPPVHWIPLHDPSRPPPRVADSLSAFVTAWAALGLDATLVLKDAHVPGWG